jgi:Rad3-related DNA helicase
VFLRASPIDVSDIIREMLLDRMTATVLTSATLSVDGRSTTCAAASASGARTKRGCLGVRLHAQAILYLPKKMPDPRSPEFVGAAGARSSRS